MRWTIDALSGGHIDILFATQPRFPQIPAVHPEPNRPPFH